MLLTEVLEYLKGFGLEVEMVGDADTHITQVAGLKLASPQHISFLNDKKYISALKETRAGAVILSAENSALCPVAHLVVEDPYYVYALVAQLLNPLPIPSQTVHPKAHVEESVTLGPFVSIAANAVIYGDSKIGQNCVIGAGAVIEEHVSMGESCRIGPNVVIHRGCILGDYVTIEAGTVIGGDGFGWANNQGQWVKIPQIGRVVIGNRVSIGNNCTIDRGAIEDTEIADNCIIDNLVHIAHNVKIGQGSAIAGQSGFAGSTSLGEYCTVAGQSGVIGHIEICDHTHVMAKSAVTNNLTEPGAYAGYPAIPLSEWRKNNVRARNLDKMAKQLKQLQIQFDSLAEQIK